MQLRTVRGTALPPLTLAKLLGKLEAKAYPAALRLGWRDFYDDISECGADHIGVVMDTAGTRVLAYVVAYKGDSGLYVSDLACDASLKGVARIDVLTELALLVRALFGDQEFYAELRSTSQPIVRLLCDVLEERVQPDHFDNGEAALLVRAVAKIPTEIERVRATLTTRVRANAKAMRKPRRPPVTAPRVAAETRAAVIAHAAEPSDVAYTHDHMAPDIDRVLSTYGGTLDAIDRAAFTPELRLTALSQLLNAAEIRAWRQKDVASLLRVMRPSVFVGFCYWFMHTGRRYGSKPNFALAAFDAARNLVLTAIAADCMHQLPRGANLAKLPLPDKLRYLVAHPAKAEEFCAMVDKNYLGEQPEGVAELHADRFITNTPTSQARPSARIAWFMAFNDAVGPKLITAKELMQMRALPDVPEAARAFIGLKSGPKHGGAKDDYPDSPGLTLWDTQGLPYGEYTTYRKELLAARQETGGEDDAGLGAELLPAVRLLRLFGSSKRVEVYVKRWGMSWHDAGQFSLPSSTNWNADRWGDLATKHGPEITDVAALFDIIQRVNGGVPTSLVKLRTIMTTSPELASAVYRRFGYAEYDVQVIGDLVAKGRRVAAPLPDDYVFGEVEYEGETHTMRVLPRGDWRGPVLGHFTSCCQSINGAGDPCARHGSASPNGGFVVIEANNVIHVASWYWHTSAPSPRQQEAPLLVFDSVEIERDWRYKPGFRENVVDVLYAQAAKQLVTQFKYGAVNVGTGGHYCPPGMPTYFTGGPPDYSASAYRDSANEQRRIATE